MPWAATAAPPVAETVGRAGAMAPADPGEVDKFRDLACLPEVAWTDLAALEPRARAREAGAAYDPARGFLAPFLGAVYELDPRTRRLTVPAGPPRRLEADFQRGLILTSYLTRAGEGEPSSRMIPPRELKGGDFFFVGAHALKTEPLIRRFGPDARPLLARAADLGAVITEAKSGQGSFFWPVLPKISLGLTFYEADEEFEAEAFYSINSDADKHLALDGLWALMNVATDELTAG